MSYFEELIKNPDILRFGSIAIAAIIICVSAPILYRVIKLQKIPRGLVIIIVSFFGLFAIIIISLSFRTADIQTQNNNLQRKDSDLSGAILEKDSAIKEKDTIIKSKTVSQLKKDAYFRKLSGVPGNNHTNEIIVDFSKLIPGTNSMLNYFNSLGISIKQPLIPEGSDIKIVNNGDIYDGHILLPTVSQNFLIQENTHSNPASFTLDFRKPIKSISFMIPALNGTGKTGIVFPEWGAFALDKDGNVIDSHQEPMRSSYQEISAQTYTFFSKNDKDITSIRFDSDNKHWAAFDAIIIEQLIITQ